MHTLKIGDSVRVLRSPYYNIKPGEICYVREMFDHGVTIYKFDQSILLFFMYDEIELAQPPDVQPIAKDQEGQNCRKLTLPIDSEARKQVPLFRGMYRYFPAALAGIAMISKAGNDKHNPGEEMHHARSKSTDQADCILRHLMDTEDLLAALNRGDSSVKPEDVLNEVNQLAWRALALSQQLHERFGAPLAPGAKK